MIFSGTSVEFITYYLKWFVVIVMTFSSKYFLNYTISELNMLVLQHKYQANTETIRFIRAYFTKMLIKSIISSLSKCPS